MQGLRIPWCPLAALLGAALFTTGAPAAELNQWSGEHATDPFDWLQNDNWSMGIPTADQDVWIETFGLGTLVLDGGAAAGLTVMVGVEGEGSLLITGTGNLQSQTGTVGVFFGSSGDVTISGPDAIWAVSDDLIIGEVGSGIITVTDGATLTVGERIYLPAHISLEGENVVATLNIGAAAGEDPAAPGFVEAGALLMETAAGVVHFNHTGADYAFSPTVSGDVGSSLQFASGYTELTANSDAFLGTATVTGGTLAVTGSLGGTVAVSGTGTLSGNGTVGPTSVASGGTLAAGSSVGTLTVSGNLTLDSGSSLLVEVDPVDLTADLVHVTGSALLNGGIVHHIGLDGDYPQESTHLILTADGGVSGTFDEVTTDFVFLDPELLYDPFNVWLRLSRNDITLASLARTPNQFSVARAIDDAGTDAPLYTLLTSLTDDDDVITALQQLTGEFHADTAGDDSNEFQWLLAQRLLGRDAPVPGALRSSCVGTPDPGEEIVAWSEGWGNEGSTRAGLRHSRQSMLFGVERNFEARWRAGAFAGFGRSEAQAGGAASASDNLHVGLYGATEIGQLCLGAGIFYTHQAVDSRRRVLFDSFDETLTASWNAGTTHIMAEAGYLIPLGDKAALMPFAGLAYVHHMADGFEESGGRARLAVDPFTQEHVVGTVGMRGELALSPAGIPMTLHLTGAWQHRFGETDPRITVSLPGTGPFEIVGTAVARDHALLGGGFDVRLGEHALLGASYTGWFLGGEELHSWRLRLTVDLSAL